MRWILLCALVGAGSALQLPVVGRAPQPTLRRTASLVMQEATPPEAPPPEPTSDSYGNFYDDEKEDAVLQAKPDISESMRARLIKEQRGIGADPNAKSPFLLVFGAVGVFVVLGALSVNM